MSSANEPFSFGAAEAARLAREVQDLGFDAAQTIVTRFVEMFAQFAGANGGAGGAGGAGRTRPDGTAESPFRLVGSVQSMRSMQSDMQRAADAYMAMFRQLSEVGLRYLDASRSWGFSEPDHDELRLPRVAPGGRSSARVWLHNTTASPAVDLRPWCPGLADHKGAALPATAVTCAPGRIDRLGPDASCELLVTVHVGQDASPGTYHGQLLVDGLPDVVFPLRVGVLPADPW